MKNTFCACCCICGQTVEPGEGHFIGRGKIAHNDRRCSPQDYRPPKKKMIALGNKFLAPCLAIGVVFAAAAAGSGDYVLITPTERICAKSFLACKAARQAIEHRWLDWAPPGSTMSCEPAPRCFDARSNCIGGYTC